MTKAEFLNAYSINDNTIVLEPWEEYEKGIIGITEDRKRIIYGYLKLIDSLLTAWDMPEEDSQEAIDWIEYNTIRSLPYLPEEYRPIICFECLENY